jgi:hypothetical protein
MRQKLKTWQIVQKVKAALAHLHQAATLFYEVEDSDAAGCIDNLEQLLIGRWKA